MDFFSDFNNLFLLVIAITSGAMLYVNSARKGARGTAVSVTDAVQLVNREHGIFIDIRSREQFRAGSIPQARNIARADLEAQADSLPRDKPVILVCDTGQQAVPLVGKLRKLGISRAVSLQGGLRGWGQAGMPLKERK